MPPPLITLIVTSNLLPEGWQKAIEARMGGDWQANLFFLDHGVALVGDARWAQISGEKIYCASGHARLSGPRPGPGIHPGGLANLGGMMRASAYTLSLPHIHWPDQPSTHLKKQVAILLNDHPASLLEAARLAAGLAGCNHKPTLYHPSPERPPFPPEATPYLEALQALGGQWACQPPSTPCKQEVIVQL